MLSFLTRYFREKDSLRRGSAGEKSKGTLLSLMLLCDVAVITTYNVISSYCYFVLLLFIFTSWFCCALLLHENEYFSFKASSVHIVLSFLCVVIFLCV